MMVVEQPPSFMRRTGSIFRRLARQRSREDLPRESRQPQKLQRRSTTTTTTTTTTTEEPTNKHLITHLQTIEVRPVVQRRPARETPLPPNPNAGTNSRRVASTDMRTTQFPRSSTVRTVAWNIFLTPEQVYRLVMGFKPDVMEDKWFVYAEGPDHSGKLKVHFHRSWTGMKIAELFVVVDLKGEGAGKVVGIKWNGSDQTNGLEEEEAKYMVSTTCAWVLGVNLEKQFI